MNELSFFRRNSEQAELIAKFIREDYQHSNVETLTFENTNDAIKEGIKRADFVIIAPYQFRGPWALEQYDWNLLQSVINETNQQAKKYTVLSLGNPYELMFVKNVKTYLAAYGDIHLIYKQH